MADDKINPKSMSFIDEDALADMNPEATQFIDEGQKEAVKKHLKKPLMSTEDAALAGLSASATEGVSSRLSGLLGAGLESLAGRTGMNVDGKMMPLIPGSKEELKTLADTYEEYKQAQNKKLKQASEESPYTYGAAQFAGGLAIPWSKVVGGAKLAKDATLAEKLLEGTRTGAKMGAVIGAANAPDYSNPAQTVESAGIGTAIGAPLGFGTTAATEAILGSAKAAGGIGRSMLGPVGKRFKQGRADAQAGIPSLATQEGLEQAKSTASKPVKELLGDLQDTLETAIKAKPKAVEEAGEKYGPLATEKVDEFYSEAVEKIQTALEKTKDQKAAEELLDLLEKFTNAKEGRLQQVTQRVYMPGKQPPPIRTSPQARAPEVMPIEEPQVPPQAPPAPMAGQPMAPVPQLQQGTPPQNLPVMRGPGVVDKAPQYATDQEAIGMGGPQPTPQNFEGYKKVMAATVDKNDKEAIQKFHQRVKEREAEEAVLPGSAATEKIEVVPQEIEGYPDKVRLVARRKVINEPADEFADQAAELAEQQKVQSKEQKEAQKLQELLAKVNQEGQDERLKQMAADEAKPYFEDITRMERPGGQDIYAPESMAALQQDLQDVTPRFGGQGYQKTPSGRLATEFATKARNMIAEHSPEIQDANTKINATKNIFESLGLDADKLIEGGGAGQKEFVKDLNNIYNLFKPETNTPQSLVESIITPEKMDYIQSQLQRIDPKLAERFANTADKQKAMLDLIRDFQKPYAGWSLQSITNAARSFGGRSAYQAGYALERNAAAVKQMAKPITDLGQRVWPQFSQQSLQAGAQMAAQSSNPADRQFSRVLSELANADERTKNSMLFILQQNVGYRQMMDKYLPQEPEKAPQAKDKELQQFK